MAYTNQVQYETIRSIDSSTFTGSYQALGSAISHPACIVKLVNNSNKDVTISINGTNDHDFLPSGGFMLYDYTSNTPSGSVNGVFAPQRRQYFVKGSAGTGSVYLVVQYIVTG